MIIQAFRDTIPKWVMGIILAVFTVPFALWGINSYFTAVTDSSAAKVNGEEISPGDFQQAYQSQYSRMQQMLGENFKPDMINEKELRQEVLDHLISEMLLNQQAAKLHYAVSDERLVSEIQKLPAFQVDGKFSPQAYRATLETTGMTPTTFEQRYRESMEVGEMQDAIQKSSFATQAQLDAAMRARNEAREIAVLTVGIKHYLDQAQVSDPEIESYYKSHQADFMTPEKVTLAYVELDEAALAKDVKVDDAVLQAQYQQQQASYQQAEARHAQHILIAVNGDDPKADAAAKAKAEDILKQLKAGADFSKLAEKYSDDPGSAKSGGDLGWVERGVMVKPFEDALFSIKQVGETAGPIRTQFGYHIIKLDDIRAPSVKPFAEVRDQLAADYRKKKADDEYYSLGDQLANLAYEHPDSLDTVSQQLNLPIQTVSDVTRDAGTGVAGNADVRKAAFSDQVLAQGLNSEPVQLSPDHVVVIRVKGHVSSEPIPLSQVRAQIVATLKRQKAVKQAEQQAQSFAQALTGGKDPASLSGPGVSYLAPKFVTRDDTGVPAAVLAEAYRLPEPVAGKPSVGTASLEEGDVAVVSVSASRPGDISGVSKDKLDAALRQLTQDNAHAEFAAYLANLRQQAKIKINKSNIEQQE